MDNYNDFANEYEAYGKNAVTDIEIGYKNVLKLLGEVKGKRILDYGCGTAKFTRILKDRGAKVIGVDIAEKEIAIAKLKYPDLELYLADDIKNKMRSDFDAAVLNFVITAIPSKETILEIFKNIHNFLKPNGRLVMMNSNYEKSANREFLSFAIGEIKPKTGAALKVSLGIDRSLVIEDYFYSREDYSSMLEQAGFVLEKIVEPLADDESHPWKDERKYPPFLIISAKK